MYYESLSEAMEAIDEYDTETLRDIYSNAKRPAHLLGDHLAFNRMAIDNREKQLKRWHRDWKINLIKEINPEFKDLSLDWE